MKYFFVFVLCAVVLQGAIVSACDCDYHPGGCAISAAPQAGYKCKCRYKGAWTCDGMEYQCNSNERCPEGCASAECCMQGGGDCGGY